MKKPSQARTNPKFPIWPFATGTSFVLMFCVIIFLLSLGLDFHETYKMLGLSKEEISSKLTAKASKPFFNNWGYWTALSRDVAATVIVAILVGKIFEEVARKKQVKTTEEILSEAKNSNANQVEQNRLAFQKYMEDLSNSVFQTILKKNMPDEIVSKAFSTILNKNLIRKNSRIVINLSNFEEEKFSQYVKLEVSHEYEIQNLTDKDLVHNYQLYYPMIPKKFRDNPPKEFSDNKFIPKLTIEGDTLSEEKLTDADKASPDIGSEKSFLDHLSVPSGGTIEIRSDTMVMKHRSDNEPWVTLLPTIGMKLEVHIDLDGDFEWEIDHLMEDKLEPYGPDAEKGGIFTSKKGLFRNPNATLLPYQGFILMWNPVSS